MKKNCVITDDVFIQLGSCSYIPTYCNYEKWLPFNKMRENIADSRMVIAHAGAGTTLLCLEMGKKPLLVTRRKQFGEHIDDHQIQFAKMMDKYGYAAVAYDASDISNIYNQFNKQDSKKIINFENKQNLISELNNWFEK